GGAVGVGVWLYLEAISWSPKFSDRYFLPVEWFWAVGLGVGLGMLGEVAVRMGRAWGEVGGLVASWGLVLGVGAWLVAGSGSGLEERRERFQRDDRRELARWIEGNLPPEARWVEDDQAQIRWWLPERVLGWGEFVVDLGTAEEWVAAGAEYAVICRDRHHRYTARGQVVRRDESGIAEVRRERYRRLLEEGEILWRSPGMDPKVLHPGLELIGLAPFGPGTRPPTEMDGQGDQGEEE
ncbi:MAG: hypothetical protein SNJ84_04630, partial [Verrucomicrobiia bacterium]